MQLIVDNGPLGKNAGHSAKRGEIAPLHRLDDDALLGQYIPLHYHGQMLRDDRRMAAFREAIETLVPEGSHVVDLGGGTGVLSYFASKRARHVTCVERLPNVAAAARRLLALNGASEKVTVVEADAREFVPAEPVDVVICEMLHVGLLRETQLEVLTAFKDNYELAFGLRIPLILPEASLLAVQPIQQEYDAHGFHAPVPLFFEPGAQGSGSLEMGPPQLYGMVDYQRHLPEAFAARAALDVDCAGVVNALRFVTKNVVGILPDEARSVDWHMRYMTIPLPKPVHVQAGDRVNVSFRYDAGGSIESLMSSLRARYMPPSEACVPVLVE